MRKDWVECKLEDIVNIVYGKGLPTKNMTTEGYDVFGANGIIGKFSVYNTEKPEVLISCRGAASGNINLSPPKCFITNNSLILKRIIEDTVDTKFLFYILKGTNKSKIITGTAQPQVTINNANLLKLPLPPLPEQRAIVKKIEALFSSLDAGIADLKKAQEQLKIYRQAVLKKAFEGISEEKKVSDIANVETGATPKRGNKLYWENGTVPWITSGALNEEFVNNFNELITLTAIKETNCKVIPKGALLIAMYGEGKTRGKCSELKIDAATNQAVAAIVIKGDFIYCKPFIKWFFIKNYNDIRLLSSGGVQPNLNLSIIKNTVIPFPSKEQQAQIVKEIESR